MEMDAPRFLRELCSADAIRPFSHYVRRTPWAIRETAVEEAFLDRMGLYCFWWAGPPEMLTERLSGYSYQGDRYPAGKGERFEHGLTPTYVGMTECAARRDGRVLKGRMVDRLVRFPTGMRRWLSSRLEAPLVKRRTGTSGNFELFGFPDRIRDRLAAMAGRPGMSLAEAQDFLDTHQPECRGLIDEFHEEYCSLMFDNYAVSFVPFADEADLFYAEALAIGVLRPCLNHS